MGKEIKITPPEGFEIDIESSTFECIKFKPIKKIINMKSEGLQLGDIITYLDGTICKVREIREDTISVSWIDKDSRDWHTSPLSATLFGPVGLTPEILEKNFNSTEIPNDPYGAYFYESNEYVEVYIKEYTDGLWEVVVDEIEFSSLPTWKMYVSNVHELQHALRLCGIDKEITV